MVGGRWEKIAGTCKVKITVNNFSGDSNAAENFRKESLSFVEKKLLIKSILLINQESSLFY